MKKAIPYLMIAATAGLAALAINSLIEKPFLDETTKRNVTYGAAAAAVIGQTLVYVKF